ncbi:MAG: hypothetical protein AB1640_10885 [bacterium]
MKVIITFMGPMREIAGQDRVEMDLPGVPTFGSALDEIGRRFGHKLPGRIWDREHRVFKAGMLVIGTGRDLIDRASLLVEGEEIKVLPMLGGG